MASATTIAATARQAITPTAPTAHAVPTMTGTTEAGSVRGRAPATHLFTSSRHGRRGNCREVGRPLLDVRVAAFLRLVAHVEEHRRVAGELLDPREPVVGRVASTP